MDYIKVASIQDKIKQALKDKKILYIKGSAGMGKTTAVENYFKRKKCLHFHAEAGFIENMPDAADIKENIVIFDDVSRISDEASQEYVLNMIEKGNKQIILIGRANIPYWLVRVSLEQDFIITSNEDLYLSDDDIKALFSSADSSNYMPDDDELAYIKEKTFCNTAALIFVARHLPSESIPTDHYLTPAMHDFYHYLGQVLYVHLDKDVKNAFLYVCLFDHFDAGLLRQLTGETDVNTLIDSMLHCGDFVLEQKSNYYTLNEPYAGYFAHKAKLDLSKNRINEIYERAALYYELKGDLLSALHCYKDSGNAERLEDTLVKYINAHPGQEDFRDVLPFYRLVPEEHIYDNPALMAGYSMCCSLAANPQKSEYFYKALVAYKDEKSISVKEKRVAENWISFLDVILPHRDKAELFEQLDDATSTSIKTKTLAKGSIPLICNASSLLDGPMDLCDIIHEHSERLEDEDLIEEEKNYLFSFYGPQSTGFLDVLKAEYSYELGIVDSHTLQSMAGKAYLEAEKNEANEVCFAAGNLLIRDYLDNGKYTAAQTMYEQFRDCCKKSPNADTKKLIDIYDIWLNMISGNNKPACDWLEEAPSSMQLSITDRKAYLLKIRILITLQRFDEAMFLIMKLEQLFKEYHRHYNGIQLSVLHAILLFRQGNEEWKSEFTKALTTASWYGFVHVIADEGAAIKPLLEAYTNKNIPKYFMDAVRKMAKARAVYFQNYMLTTGALDDPLTEAEQKVINLMCQELPSDEICDILCISYSGLKFHRQNIYRKLGAKNRTDAQRIAKSLGLVN